MSASGEGSFEWVPPDPSCPYCRGEIAAPAIDVDAVYCISLIEQPHRSECAAAHFHQIGLCQRVIFYKTRRLSDTTSLGVWLSHRAVARHALARGEHRVLILEDDVEFRQDISVLARRINRALRRLPAQWWGLFLGHIPIQAYFVGLGLVRARSAALHAYIAHTPLLEWYDRAEPRSPAVPMWQPLASSVDAATSSLPGMYALFPMAVFQKDMSDGRVDDRFDASGRPRRWNDIDRWRYIFIFRIPRLIEVLAALASPVHWLTMDRLLRRIEEDAEPARTLAASGLFDPVFYRRAYRDMASGEVDPLAHYLKDGAREGRWPNASFDPKFYARHATDLKPGDNPLLHYLRVGRARGLPVHPPSRNVWQDADMIRSSGLFDEAFYLKAYPDVAAANTDPLLHYVRHGAGEGRWPNAAFDPRQYIDAFALDAGQNPLIHYIDNRGRAD